MLALFSMLLMNQLETCAPLEENMINTTTTIEWLSFVKQSTSGTTPYSFATQDGNILIEWKSSGILSDELASFKHNIADIAAKILAPVEMNFLKAFPDAVHHEMFLKPCIPLFANGLEEVDWFLVEQTIQTTIKQFYLADLSKFGAEMIEPLLNDIYLFATLKNKENEILGFMLCSVTPALSNGDVKLINFLVIEQEQNKGLEKLLFSSLFHIVPEIKRVFCFARPTNTCGLKLYENLGFKIDLSPIEDPNHKVNMNYLIQLQCLAAKNLTNE